MGTRSPTTAPGSITNAVASPLTSVDPYRFTIVTAGTTDRIVRTNPAVSTSPDEITTRSRLPANTPA